MQGTKPNSEYLPYYICTYKLYLLLYVCNNYTNCVFSESTNPQVNFLFQQIVILLKSVIFCHAYKNCDHSCDGFHCCKFSPFILTLHWVLSGAFSKEEIISVPITETKILLHAPLPFPWQKKKSPDCSCSLCIRRNIYFWDLNHHYWYWESSRTLTGVGNHFWPAKVCRLLLMLW